MKDVVTHRKETADLSFIEILQANRTIVRGFFRCWVLEGREVVLYVSEGEGGCAWWGGAVQKTLAPAVDKGAGEEEVEEENSGKAEE